MSDKVLSQDEIDELLQAIENCEKDINSAIIFAHRNQRIFSATLT